MRTLAVSKLSAAALLGALALLAAACASDSSPSPSPSQQSKDYGPLAVVDGLGGSKALAGTGPINIRENCVTLSLPSGKELLLIWHAAEVSWDKENREITFTSALHPGAQPITIRDGDTVTVGGESLQGDAPVDRDLRWLATPSPDCSGEQWAVSSVTKP